MSVAAFIPCEEFRLLDSQLLGVGLGLRVHLGFRSRLSLELNLTCWIMTVIHLCVFPFLGVHHFCNFRVAFQGFGSLTGLVFNFLF